VPDSMPLDCGSERPEIWRHGGSVWRTRDVGVALVTELKWTSGDADAEQAADAEGDCRGKTSEKHHARAGEKGAASGEQG
jgi:hypothetical protein